MLARKMPGRSGPIAVRPAPTSHRCAFLCAGLLALGLLVPRPAAAAWPTDPLVNVPLCTVAGEQNTPQTVSDGAGGAIVIWIDKRGGSTTTDVYAQRVDAAGAPLWTAGGVPLCTLAGDQSLVKAVSDGAGGAIATWIDFSGGDDAYDVSAQRVDGTGAALWTPDGVPVCTATGSQFAPSIVSDGASGAIIAWTDNRSGSSGSFSDVYAQRLNATGAAQWTANGVALCIIAGEQGGTLTVSDGAGGAIVAWIDVRGGNYDIYAQRINASGAVQWTAGGLPACTSAGDQILYGSAADGANGTLLSWLDTNAGVNDIYAQRLDGAGAALWTANGVGVCTAAGGQNVPNLVSDGAGGAIISWLDARGANTDVYAQRVDGAGTPQWIADGVGVCTAAGSQTFSPRIVSDGAGGAIIAWPDPRNGNQDLYAQRVNGAGTPQWIADGVAVTTAAASQGTLTMVPDGVSGAVVSWVDLRNSGDFDLYAQRVLSDGTLGGDVNVVPISQPVGLALLAAGLAIMALLGTLLNLPHRSAAS